MSASIVAIVGPTAVGKSAVADRVARALDTDVLSVDAMQVYRGMDIGTAKTPVNERLVPLRLVDLVDPAVNYSAALFQRDARCEIERLRALGKPVVLCGGTGLYLRAALDEMDFPAGETKSDARVRYERLANEAGSHALHELLRSRDPRSADVIHEHNVRRVIRALEMLDEGTSYADQKAAFSAPRPRYEAVYFGLTMERERLYQRIDDRVDAMIAAGLIDEVERLMDAGAAPALTARQAIGYKELIAYLEGTIALDEAVELIKMRSRRYAKRQLSWFRRDGRISWISMDELDEDAAATFILDAIGRS
ncbi:tRNA (adenosine(37)-N6)-dimethylallyltransferase MiaA [uncultured Enorma sp.]|uniref:tRNA (adenosine(37)-N6)-dimethylallyltransferase MiaA n=1 Tax=uncultured Enorma sp. TaxID=1714346 RepID=UPI00265F6774|nr:tRNA (adenosine(37)-N6)-dimethylallyltransferase MiaA [uncultured Enorma sp.]